MESVAGGLEGVLSVKADFVRGTATVEYDSAKITPDQIVDGINTQTFYQARLPDLNVATAVLSIPALTDQPAADQLNLAFDGIDGIYGGEVAPGQLTIEFDPELLTAEGLVERINERTTLVAILESVDLPSAKSPPLSLQSVARYGIWGAVAVGVLWWTGALRAVRLRLLPQVAGLANGLARGQKRSRGS